MRRVDPKLYTKKYYLTDCSGYKEFNKSWGKKLEPRIERIVKEIPNIKDMKILDIGCGRGEMVFWAAEKGAKNVVGIDYSSDAIDLSNLSKKHYSTDIQKKVNFKKMDANKLGFPDKSFDGIFMIEVMEHLYPEEQERVLKEINRVLKDDGFVLIHTAPNKWFNDFTYRFWCYPVSTLLVKIYYIFTRHSYKNIFNPKNLRKRIDLLLHVNEPDYFSLKYLYLRNGFVGSILSTNITVKKNSVTWKDDLFNFLVYLYPLSRYLPCNILWGNDFFSILKKIQ